jgi:hypothetical protein
MQNLQDKTCKMLCRRQGTRGYSSGWKIQIQARKWMVETLKRQICKNNRKKTLHCAKSLTAEHVFCSS